ncbi:MAG: S9 family peptidase, partial [Kangiellaceae bacterium]|nr:S9 family peptidase [Kangiellaceae bacterium]
TDYPISITSYKISHDNQKLLFSASVYPDCKTLQCTADRNEQKSQLKTTGVVYDKMFVRHWDHWIDETQSQLFAVELQNTNKQNKIIRVSHSVNANVPSDPFGGDEEYSFSAAGDKVYFSARIQNSDEPTSTNFDLYSVNLDTPSKAKLITPNNKAWDTQPILSSDGKSLAYLAMKRPGFEADKFDLMQLDLENNILANLTKDWDRSFSTATFAKDNQSVYLTGNNTGTKALWKLDLSNGQKTLFNKTGYIGAISIGKNKLVFAKDSLTSPVQLFSANLDGSNQKQITFSNQEKLNKIAFGDYQQFSFKGWNDEQVHGYVVKPANFEQGKKYPLAFLIHGGPQGSFGDHFHYRWNPQTYAGQGFVAVMIDFHGSTGYGQKFTDSITQNWGSRPLEDLKKGLKFALKEFDFIDGNRACALGASYGGYMINWIEGHWQDQFDCLVNHDGIFDNRMMYYSTEELWFVEWEHGGSYYDNPKKHEQYNPANYVENWKTPMLVIQGGKDYRIPETQALATFTALQKKNIPSKLLYFPDENHWVLKPNNSLQWHHEVNQWLHKYLD